MQPSPTQPRVLTRDVAKRQSGYYFVKLYADAPWRPLFWDATSQTFDALGVRLGAHQVHKIDHKKLETPNA